MLPTLLLLLLQWCTIRCAAGSGVRSGQVGSQLTVLGALVPYIAGSTGAPNKSRQAGGSTLDTRCSCLPALCCPTCPSGLTALSGQGVGIDCKVPHDEEFN